MATATQTAVLIKCRFTRGGFGHERVFWIPTPDGKGEYRGLAYIGYCYKRDRVPLRLEEPPPGKAIDGLVVGRVIEIAGQVVTLQVPDGELCDVDSALTEEASDVPVGS